MMNNYDFLMQQAKKTGEKRRIAVAAAHDFHTLEGLSEAQSDNLIAPILIGDREKIEGIIEKEQLNLQSAEIVDEKNAQRAVETAVSIVREGCADILMKGAAQTSELMKVVVNKEYGLNVDNIMSHVGLFQIPAYPKLILLTDGGLMIAPDLEQKKKIILNAVEVMTKLGSHRPKVAALCAAEVVNEQIVSSVDAAKLKKWNMDAGQHNFVVEGPISFDLMFDSQSAKMKGYESPVAGDADIWLMPDITSGNLVAKSLIYAGGAQMAGLITGASVPIVLVSRGASAREKYLSLAFAAAVTSEMPSRCSQYQAQR